MEERRFPRLSPEDADGYRTLTMRAGGRVVSDELALVDMHDGRVAVYRRFPHDMSKPTFVGVASGVRPGIDSEEKLSVKIEAAVRRGSPGRHPYWKDIERVRERAAEIERGSLK